MPPRRGRRMVPASLRTMSATGSSMPSKLRAAESMSGVVKEARILAETVRSRDSAALPPACGVEMMVSTEPSALLGGGGTCFVKTTDELIAHGEQKKMHSPRLNSWGSQLMREVSPEPIIGVRNNMDVRLNRIAL